MPQNPEGPAPAVSPRDTASLLEVDPAALGAFFGALGEPPYRSQQVLDWVFKRRVTSFEAMTNLSLGLREELAKQFCIGSLRLVMKTGSHDTTQKFLFQLGDGRMIETVLIPASPALYGAAADRRTACVSSQVGCAYGCKFCASGLAGFARNLDAGEIVEQVLAVEAATGERVNNIVFMGMGEPLANLENLAAAIHTINAEWGVGIGARHMTVSTSGLAPQIEELAEVPLQIRLAVSLHGATDEVRDRIMPVNRRYPLARLMEALQLWRERKRQRITFEYILIAGVNDRETDAAALAGRSREVGAKINLIPYNTVEGLGWRRPDVPTQERFRRVLEKAGVPATIRREKGHDIDAACGQLRLKKEVPSGATLS